jgi:predicted nucleic acid-binding protein
MRAERFLDTNILVYAFTVGDPRCAVAESIVAEGGCISVQVLNEFVNVLNRKLRLPWAYIRQRLEVIEGLLEAPTPLSLPTHRLAADISEEHGVTIYDALIVASATESKCRLLLSEDLQHGRTFGAVTVENPFRSNAS